MQVMRHVDAPLELGFSGGVRLSDPHVEAYREMLPNARIAARSEIVIELARLRVSYTVEQDDAGDLVGIQIVHAVPIEAVGSLREFSTNVGVVVSALIVVRQTVTRRVALDRPELDGADNGPSE